MGTTRRYLTCTTIATDDAAEAGHLSVLQWLHANRSEGCTAVAMYAAAANGHMDVVKWLHANTSAGCTTKAMDKLAARVFHTGDGYHHLLGGECCQDKRPDSFINEQLALLEWLHTNRSEGCTAAAMRGAAAAGNLEVLQWLQTHTHIETSVACTSRAMTAAAAIGRLDIVKWLHENHPGCRTKGALIEAASYGHLDIMKWLLTINAEACSQRAMDGAAGGSLRLHHHHLAIVKWLFKHGGGAHAVPAMMEAVSSKQFEVLVFLHAHKTTNPSDVEIENMKLHLDGMILSDPTCQEMREWLCENYPAQ